MLAWRRLPPRVRTRMAPPWLVHPNAATARHIAPTSAFHRWRSSSAVGRPPTERKHELFTASVAAQPLPRHRAAGSDGGVPCVSGSRRATTKAKVAHGARTEIPAIPAFVGIRELANLLRVKPRALFKSLGGYQSKKRHRIVLSGVPYAFPNLGNVIVPFEDAQAVAKVLGKDIRFLDIDKQPRRAALAAAPPYSPEGNYQWEEGRHDGRRRRPVVVLLGHFNHGKTTILDALLGQGSGIAERETGGITQEIRARTVCLGVSLGREEEFPQGDREGAAATAAPPPPADPIFVNRPGNKAAEAAIGAASTDPSPAEASSEHPPAVATFLDTPGQEIFYRMRTNGARVADAVVLVVSAVDGVCLQTSESIGCVEELGLPAVVALNKIDLLPKEAVAQRVSDLSAELREYVATEEAEVVPVSARTGHGLDSLRTAVAAALSRGAPSPEHLTSIGPQEGSGSEPRQGEPLEDCRSGVDGLDISGSEPRQDEHTPDAGCRGVEGAAAVGSLETEAGVLSMTERGAEGAQGGLEVVMADAPEGAATATVLDYTSSAKAGKMLLVLVDRGTLRPGDAFVSGMLWGFVRSMYDEEGDKLLEHAGPGVAAKIVVVARTRVSNAPLGEPFRVLTEDAAEKVALVRNLGRSIDDFVDYFRLERDFSHLLDNGDAELKERKEAGEVEHDNVEAGNGPQSALFMEQAAGRPDVSGGGGAGTSVSSVATAAGVEDSFENPMRRRRQPVEEEDLAPEDMPVTIVVKADSANTLASVVDAIGDWGDGTEDSDEAFRELRAQEDNPAAEDNFNVDGSCESARGEEKGASTLLRQPTRQDWGERDLQHKRRQRLVISLARSGVGAVTTTDVRLARDCECPVFAHNVKTDAAAARELKRVGGAVVRALPEGHLARSGEGVGVGGQEGFIGRGGEGKECVVVSETVGELLGEIERFVLRVR